MGLQRTQDAVCAVDRGLVVVPLSFSVSGGACTVQGGDLAASVTYSAAGSYVVNLSDAGYSCICAVATLSAASGSGGSKLETGTVSMTSKQVPIRLYNGSNVLADPASANDRINVVLYIKKTAVTKGGGPL